MTTKNDTKVCRIEDWKNHLGASWPLLEAYAEAVLAMNARVNLTAILDRETALLRMVADSLETLNAIPEAKRHGRLLDIGTGGGFPLVPLAVAMPEVQCVGLDSVGKKCAAVAEMCAQLGISNVTTVTGRAEVFGRTEARESYDIVTSRAVGCVAALAEVSLPLAKVGGCVLMQKTQRETDAALADTGLFEVLGARAEIAHTYAMPGDADHRVILRITKLTPTDERFPRRDGVPFRKPLSAVKPPPN